MVWVFVCVEFIVPLENFSLIWRRPFIIVISDPWQSHLLLSVWQWICHFLFLRLRSVTTRGRSPIFRLRGEHSISTPRGGETPMVIPPLKDHGGYFYSENTGPSDFIERFTRSTFRHFKTLYMRSRDVSELCRKAPKSCNLGPTHSYRLF